MRIFRTYFPKIKFDVKKKEKRGKGKKIGEKKPKTYLTQLKAQNIILVEKSTFFTNYAKLRLDAEKSGKIEFSVWI